MRGNIRQLPGRVSGLPLRWQIGSLVVVGLVTIFVVFGMLGAAIADDAKRQTLDGWLAVTRSTAGAIDSVVDLQYTRLERTSALFTAAGDDEARRLAVLTDALGDNGSSASGAALLDARDRVLWASSADASAIASAADQLHLAGAVSSSPRFASGAEDVGGSVAAILAVPVFDRAGRPAGALAILLRPDAGPIHDLVASARGLANSGHAELVDGGDRVLVSSEAQRDLGPGEHPDFYVPLLAQHQSAVGLTAPVGSVDPADQGQRHDMAFVPLRTVPWALALGGSDAELSADSNRWQTQIVLVGSLLLAIALLLVWLTTRRVARPILALAAASKEIAAGDLDTVVPQGGEGEVRVLAQAFDHMRRQLHTALGDLALEKSRYEGIIASMADALITTDLDLRITAFNPSAEILTGWRVYDAIGRPCSEVIGACADATAGLLKTTLRRRDGRDVPVSITRSPIHDQAGQPAGVVHVLRDISAEAEVDRLKDEFLSTVSHELRTPLGFIMGYATSLLLPDAIEDRAMTRRCVEVIAQSSDELRELVDNLLDMSKIGSGSLSVSPEPTLLGPLIDEAVQRIRIRAPHHEFVVTGNALAPIRADPRRVGQVLYNLLDNAIKYSPDGGRIVVRARENAAEAIVSVIDEGVGIAPQELSAVFERFHRGQIARTRGIAGTGLGLAISRGIVEAHGGLIWAESPTWPGARPGRQGTAIHFTLPLAAAGAGVPQ
ncbi:MAG TPA: ATP-binding protein [Candidatus Limnocylindria bacterium]